ncbi:thioredoxin-like protein [Tothia fuscella]|uniref:Thioredoxin-like protein n=1 Tax=Tothia fuscella TaxID=1048955 RepID=A0A9P4NEC3_9PEZI|nr:thioredoxin-like protein [Tothia fuscella]
MPMQVEVDPNEDTEWNDILRKHGVIPEKPLSPTPMIEEALNQARELAHENRLEGKDLDELAALEEDEDEDFLEQYRQRRIAELNQIVNKSVYNQVYPLQKPDWSTEVTEESKKAFIFVLLTSSQGNNVESRVMIEVWRQLAPKFGEVKFGQIRADLCIEDYPDKNTPTILVYKDGDIRKQVVTLKELNGPRTGVKDIEQLMVDLGAVKLGDPRFRQRDDDDEQAPKTIRSSNISKRTNMEDGGDDSDWD